jgi:hypothetical protein
MIAAVVSIREREVLTNLHSETISKFHKLFLVLVF